MWGRGGEGCGGGKSREGQKVKKGIVGKEDNTKVQKGVERDRQKKYEMKELRGQNIRQQTLSYSSKS